jgi:hypothetical protein
MSEKINRLALAVLRTDVFNALPAYVQSQFAMIPDPYNNSALVPNMDVGALPERGSSPTFPTICVYSDGTPDNMVNVYRHISLHIDIWAGGANIKPVDARKMVGIIYQAVYAAFQNTNWSKNGVSIQRSYEIENPGPMYIEDSKLYDLPVTFRVEAISRVWY